MQKKLKVLTGSFIACLLTGAACCEAADATSATDVNFNLVNGIYIRILDKTGSQPISSIDLNTIATEAGVFVSDNFLVDVGTANKTGYNLYVTSSYQTDPEDESTKTTSLVHQENSSYIIPTLESTISLANFTNGSDDDSGVSSTNRWGMSIDNTTFSPISLNSTMIDGSSEPTASRMTPVYVGLNVNMEKPAGDYKNTLVFSAIANAVPTEYRVAFGPGATDTVSNMPTDIVLSEVSAQHTFTLPTTVPTRSGYDFTGWKDEADGTIYQAGSEYTVASDEYNEGNATLVAQWMEDPWKSISTMQAMTTTACNNAVVGKTKSLRDTRDSKYYSVIKLADGKCWMKSNLALVGSKTLTSSDSDVSSSFVLPAADTEDWCMEDTASCINKRLVHYHSSKYYYNWYTATAGTGTFSTTAGTSASSSICPKGWKLPTNTQMQALLNAYSDRTELSNLLNFSLAGRYWWIGSSWYYSSGGIWTRTLRYSAEEKYPSISYSAYNVNDTDLKRIGVDKMRDGSTVRCIR